MTYDTLTHNGAEISFNEWGFSLQVKDRLRNQAQDEFWVNLPVANIVDESTNPTFPFEAQVIVRTNRASADGSPNSFSGGTITFQGKRVGQPIKSSASGQGVGYKFAGPWYDLENTHYQQMCVDGLGVEHLLAETILNTSTAVTNSQIQISLGDQIQAILQWLLDQYAAQGMSAPFQYVGRALNAGVVDLNVDSTVQAERSGGNIGFSGINNGFGIGFPYNFKIPANGLTISSIFYSVFYPSYITKPLMCADALKKCLEQSPRANIYFDYTTLPPTCHVTQPEDMTPKTLPLFDGVSHKSINIQRRDDLLVRTVNINYRITTQINAASVVNYAQDKWGPNGSNNAADPQTGLRVINELVDLLGGNQTTTQAHLDVEPVLAIGGSQATKRAWWASKRGGEIHVLEDFRVRFQAPSVPATIPPTVAATIIPDAVIVDSVTNAVLSVNDLIAAGLCDRSGNLVLNRLVRGSHHAWMARNDGQPVVSKKVKIFSRMVYAEYDKAGNSETDIVTGNFKGQRGPADHHVNIEVTNGITATYSTISSSAQGEFYIIGAGGIAQYLFNHLNALQYDGDAIHVAAEFADASAANYIHLGCTLNLSNGDPEWAEMNAQVQGIERDYGTHEVVVRIGVANHLNAGDLSALLNMWRNRRPWYNPLIRTNSALGSNGLVDQAITGGQANSVTGLSLESALGLMAYETPGDAATSVVASINFDVLKIQAILAATNPILVET